MTCIFVELVVLAVIGIAFAIYMDCKDNVRVLEPRHLYDMGFVDINGGICNHHYGFFIAYDPKTHWLRISYENRDSWQYKIDTVPEWNNVMETHWLPFSI